MFTQSVSLAVQESEPDAWDLVETGEVRRTGN
jgi:hypothetical protein